jgi:amino acid transporter
VIAVGAFAALTTTLMTCLLSQPRILMAMARDGLFWSFVSNIHPRFKTPINAIAVTGSMSALLALLLDVESLAEVASIGTLISFVGVGVCVLSIRYSDSVQATGVRNALLLLLIGSAVSGTCLVMLPYPYNLTVGGATALAILASGVMFMRMRSVSIPDGFSVPLMPWTAVVSVWFNIFMMCNLNVLTWLRLFVWCGIGFAIYVFYGIRHSRADQGERVILQSNDESSISIESIDLN